jgi:uncharacterized lipoprotein YddW (UPF0748 family)
MRHCQLTVASVLAVAMAVPIAPVGAQARSAPPELRGVWVLRASLTSSAAIDAVVENARRGGFNAIFVQVRGRGEAFYRSALEPRAGELSGQPAGFDPLARTLTAARRAGLQVHAWINVNLVSSAVTLPRASNHVVLRHPEWLMLPEALALPLRRVEPAAPAYVAELARWTRAAAGQLEGLYLSPISDDARTYTTAIVRELVTSYDLDGLHLDYIRYPAETFDYSALALDAFRRATLSSVNADERRRLDGRTQADPAAWPRAYPDGWAEFRRDQLTRLLTALRATARTTRPRMAVSAAVVPDPDEARRGRLQDWAGWIRSGLLDAICPMVYTADAAEYARLMARVHEAADPYPIWAGIGAYRLRVEETAARVRVARRGGASGIVLFRYDSLSAPARPNAGVLADLRAVLVEGDAGGRRRSP